MFRFIIRSVLLLAIVQSVLSIQYVDENTEDDDKSSYKVADYIGVYVAVFICAFPIAYHVFDFLGLFDNIVTRLGNKAHQNFLLEIHHEVHLKSGTISLDQFKSILTEFYKAHNHEKIVNVDAIIELYKGWEQALLDQLEEKYHHPVNVNVKVISESKDVVVEVNSDGTIPTTEEAADIKEKDNVKYETICGREKNLCGKKFPVYDYHGDFKKSLIAGRSYYNSYDGIRSDSCFCLAASLYSDAMFFFFNNHSLFAMSAALKGHPFSRYNRRMAFIVRHGLAFLISVAFFMLPLPESAKSALNTLFI